MMTSRERIYCAINGTPADHTPFTLWCFGFKPPDHLAWSNNGKQVKFWYSRRLEHIHTLAQEWTTEDDFKRVLAWFSLGVDDVLDVSVPWGIHRDVSYSDFVFPAGASEGDINYPVLVRDYSTPAGSLRHAVKETGREPDGWPVQPPSVQIFDDFNVPRGVRHLVNGPSDVDKVRFLYMPPGDEQEKWLIRRMNEIRPFADEHGVFVQAWTAFGMDAAVWLSGVENATMLAMTDPDAFGKLIDSIAIADYARTRLAANTPGIDMICQRGWYSSTDFWSPEIFDLYVYPYLKQLTELTHRYGKKFAYVMTTGIETLGPRLADAGVDVLYFIDPVMDTISLRKIAELIGNRMTLVGGISTVKITESDPKQIEEDVREVITLMRPTNRFILHPVDSIFPDTPWSGIEAVIKAWKLYR